MKAIPPLLMILLFAGCASSTVENPNATSSADQRDFICTINQIRGMKRLGMSDSQVFAACPSLGAGKKDASKSVLAAPPRSKPRSAPAMAHPGASILLCRAPWGDSFKLTNESGNWVGTRNNRRVVMLLEMSTNSPVFNDYEDCVGRLYAGRAADPMAVINFSQEVPGRRLSYEGEKGWQCTVSQSFAHRGLCSGRIYAKKRYW